jgi:hypothetical protein
MTELTSTVVSSSTRKNPNGRRLLIAATLASVVLAFVPGADILLYPVVLFGTIVHEGGHAVMAILTGGGVQSIGINPDGSGVTYSIGGIPAFTYMAGYLGATLFGAAALHIGRRKGAGRRSLILMAILVLAVTLFWIHPWSSPFGFVTGIAISALMFAAARFVSEPAAHFLASFLAVQLSLNALYGIRTLLFITTHTSIDNDAVFMARDYLLTPWFWAGLWAILSIGILAVSLRVYWRESR